MTVYKTVSELELEQERLIDSLGLNVQKLYTLTQILEIEREVCKREAK
jgi:hypothetical protein